MPEAMPETGPEIRPEPQYATMDQQADAAAFGMWIFLATEVLFFGGMLFAYTIYRGVYPEGFAEAGRHTKIVIGTVNTVILLTSSFIVAWAVHLAERGRGRGVAVLLGVAALFGVAFLGLKGFEYYQEWHEGLIPGIHFQVENPHASAMELFYFLYFMMTGVHGLHVTIGIGLMGVMAVRAWRGAFSSAYHTPVEITGLYWHFVDIVWIFLYPLIYLTGRSGG